MLGFSGDVSDMQHIDRMLQALATEEAYSPTDHSLDAANLHKYLQKVMYQRRTKMDPLWNAILVAGFDETRKPYLATVDLLGTSFTSPSLATGFGAHLAQPLLRRIAPDEESAAKLTQEEAVAKIRECMKVLYYRDARSAERYSIAVVTKDGVDLKEDELAEGQSWAFGTYFTHGSLQNIRN